MPKIPQENPLMDALNDTTVESHHRPHIGLSELDNECLRALQYKHYWAYDSNHTARIERLFQVGHAAEDLMIADLNRHGYKVTDRQKELIGITGHWKGHIDGVVTTKDGLNERLVEFKTHNDASFKDLKKKGVQKSKHSHYVQMQSYMDHMNLIEAMYMALNKNTSEYYIEYVDIDAGFCGELERKQLEVVMAETLLPKVSKTPAWYKCKLCSAIDVCHKGKEVSMNCRTCDNVDVMDNGEWHCNKLNINLDDAAQRLGCDHYTLGEIFK